MPGQPGQDRAPSFSCMSLNQPQRTKLPGGEEKQSDTTSKGGDTKEGVLEKGVLEKGNGGGSGSRKVGRLLSSVTE